MFCHVLDMYVVATKVTFQKPQFHRRSEFNRNGLYGNHDSLILYESIAYYFLYP